MNVPEDLRYTQSHEWVRLEDDGTITVGITDHAQEQLGDLVFVETPEIDADVEAEAAVAVVESVKAASDVYSPIAGEVTDVNDSLADEPELINSSPYEDGWIFRLRPEDATVLDELMTAEDYQRFLAELED